MFEHEKSFLPSFFLNSLVQCLGFVKRHSDLKKNEKEERLSLIEHFKDDTFSFFLWNWAYEMVLKKISKRCLHQNKKKKLKKIKEIHFLIFHITHVHF